MAEPLPDIHKLFAHYNSLYFDDALGACIVSWTSLMTSTSSNCHFAEAGLCEICLSESLLQSCSSANLKNVLLHEMIHAFLLITEKNNHHSDHGPNFWAIANLINSNCRDDNQRPSGGYRITDEHGFDDVHLSSVHQWKCASCGDLIIHGLSREPSLNDCLEKSGNDSDCGNLSCGWHRHKKRCPGRYEKVDFYSGIEDEGRAVDDAEEIEEQPRNLSDSARKARERLHTAEEIKGRKIIKRPRTVSEFFLSAEDSASHGDCSNGKHLSATGLKTSSFSIDLKISKQPRTFRGKKFIDLIDMEEKCLKREREITLVMEIFGVYTDEESGEDTEPLINKRSESRKRMRLL